MDTQQKLDSAKSKIAEALAAIDEVAASISTNTTPTAVGYLFNSTTCLTTAIEFVDSAKAKLN